ncbi:zinc-binding dehydrogenase [Galbitalea soli]|uniref:NAD(P)H-quinone oxidoreductase n=1 Tax=Galbitalea soli TaxID=1268042 RepID=A0A7C9PM97_9MICO|nr:NAD(P)H-quinone oxidoreductase [Galbitalea soli]NYJ31490.1 putative PIG3 family NAD(P)H quinone oxidoreductase [Galbitalea soli]
MRAVVIPCFGGPEVLTVGELDDPVAGPGQVVIRVAAAGVNRADLHQVAGHYPPPAGAPEWPGMEVSGVIASVGAPATDGIARPRFAVGDRVCALTPGGGYAERLAVDAALVLPVPDSVDLVDAAGIPEAAATVWANVVMAAGLRPGQRMLVHGGSSGVGSFAVQLGAALGATVFATAGGPAKVAFCERLGAIGIDYRAEDFAEVIAAAAPADGSAPGVDVVLDLVGGDYLDRNVRVLRTGGTVMIIANQSGAPGIVDLGELMRRRGRIWATTLRARPFAERAEILAGVRDRVMPLYAEGRIRTVTDSVFPFESAAEAHRRMASGAHSGKILLTP